MTLQDLITEYHKLIALYIQAIREGRDASLIMLLERRTEALGIDMFVGPGEGQVEFDNYGPLQPVSA